MTRSETRRPGRLAGRAARAGRDGRTTTAILAQPRWSDVDPAVVEAHIASGALTPVALRDLDHCLAFVEELADGAPLDAETLLAFNGDRKTARKLYSVRQALSLLFEQHPLLHALSRATQAMAQRTHLKRARASRAAKPLVFSVAETDLPDAWRTALSNMHLQLPGIDAAPPAPAVVKAVTMVMRQFAKAAQDAGLTICISREAAAAHERALVSRKTPLAAATVQLSLKNLKHFARYIGAEPALVAYLGDRVRVQQRRSHKSETLKEQKVRKIPGYAAVFERVLSMLEAAENARNLMVAQKNRNFAAAIGLFCPFPLRVADTVLRFGDNISWSGTAYHLFLPATSKNDVPMRAEILPFFAIFLDQLILHGHPVERLDEMRERCIKQRRHLFVDHNGEPYHTDYVSRAWWKVFGTGNHAARIKIHDEFAIFGVAGIEAALAACAQRSPVTAKFYRSRAFTLRAGDHVHRALENDITPAEWEEYFRTD